jgi:hypothetical protein
MGEYLSGAGVSKKSTLGFLFFLGIEYLARPKLISIDILYLPTPGCHFWSLAFFDLFAGL